MSDSQHRQDPPIEALLDEQRRFEPSPEFRAGACAADEAIYDRAQADPQGFWEGFARQLQWSTPWERVLEGEAPHWRWFVGGKLNASVNCLDRHVQSWRRNKAAILWEGEPGDRRVLTYLELHAEVNRCASVLRRLEVQRGDVVALYLPMIPELVVAMLACARIGAVHSVVFGGFSSSALADRIQDAQAKVLITADGGYRRGGVVPLKQAADAAVADCPSIRATVVVRRVDQPVEMQEGDSYGWCMDHMPDAPAM